MTSITENRSFSPMTISGCTLWLDAADSSTITGTSSVTAWTDKSGLGNSPSFGANKPSYTGSFIETSNSNVDFTIPISTINTNSGQGGVLFFVFVDKQDNANYPALFSSGNPGQRFYQILLYNYGYEVSGNKLTQTGLDAMNTTNFILYSFSYVTGSSVSVRVNGSEILSSSVYAPNPSGQIYIGKDGWGDGTGNLKLKEILFFNTIFTDNQRQQIEGYLSWKWGLQRSLPGAHPNYSVNPSGPFPSFALPTTAFKVKSNPAFFTPTSVAGCTLWLDGADPSATGIAPANGATVSTWVDKSTNGLTVSAASSQPTYLTNAANGLGTVAFNGSQGLSAGTVTGTKLIGNTNSCAIYAVVRFENTSGRSIPYSWDDQTYEARFLLQYAEGNNIALLKRGGTNTTIPLINTLYYIVSYWQNGLNTQLNVNGTTIASLSNFSNNDISSFSRVFNVGYYANDPAGWNMRGNIAEILFFNTHIPTNFQQIEGYLAWKWGIQTYLPGVHPNYSSNGYTISPFPLFSIPTTPFKVKFQRNTPISFMYESGYTWYDTRDMTTTVFTDKGPNAYHGNMSSLLSTTSGPYSDMTGLVFTSTQTVGCPTGYVTNNFTISYWAYFINKPYLGGIGYQYILTGGRLQVHQYVNNATIYFNSGGTEFITLTNPGANWSHFIFVYNTTAGTITVYENGLLSKTSTTGVNGASGFGIGKTGDYHFQSYLSDIRIVPILLTADQANTFYRSYASGTWKIGY